MYTIYVDNASGTSVTRTTVWAPAARRAEYIVLEPKLKQEINKASVLTFKMPKDNAAYNAISLLTSTVLLYDGDTCIFMGRPLSVKRDFWNNKLVTCEDALAWLGDAVIEPYSCATWQAYMTMLSTAYNAQAAANRQITFANNITGNETFESEDYSTALDEFLDVWIERRQAAGATYDVFAELTYNPGGSPVVKLAARELWTGQGQTIEFGKNLLDLEEYLDAEDLYTVIVPLGRTDSGTGLPMTVSGATDSPGTGYTRSGIYVTNTAAAASFGTITKAVRFSEPETANELQAAGVEELGENLSTALSLTVTALDLRAAGVNTDALRIGQLNRIYSAPHGYDSVVQCKKIQLDMSDPEKSKYSFGVTRKSLTQQI